VRAACPRAGQFCPQLDSPATRNQSVAAISQDLSTFRFGTTMALRVRAARDPTNDTPLQSHERPWEAMLNQFLHDLRVPAACCSGLTTCCSGSGPGDPRTLAVTAAMLVMVGAVACVIPARRATRLDPRVALRAE